MHVTLNNDKIKNLFKNFKFKKINKCYHTKIQIQLIGFFFFWSSLCKGTKENRFELYKGFYLKGKKCYILRGKKSHVAHIDNKFLLFTKTRQDFEKQIYFII
jgi:hypothetical protein